MRVDYYHVGDSGQEHFAFDRAAIEGDWPGPLNHWIDDSNLGRYQFQVLDPKSKRLIYSRGFASVYGEWETTDEAKHQWRALPESVRFPAPTGPVELIISKRGPRNEWVQVWSTIADPADPAVDRASAPKFTVWPVVHNGVPQDKVDLLLLGDGYKSSEMEKWHRDAKRTAETLLSAPPFREHRSQFNVWAIDTPADETGISRPSDGIYRRTPLGASYDAFGSERYILTLDNRRLREIAAAAPYEFIEIVVNDRKYGGGGIFNDFATVSADNAFTPYVLVHEFGHHFAGLADEYYTSDVAYGSPTDRPEPWEPNVTADPHAAKWSDLLTPGIALPTPWPKAEFERMQADIQARRREVRAQHKPEDVMETLFREERVSDTKLLGSGPNAGKTGAFEGANYEARGYYRPRQDCIMFTRDEVGFCAVCRRAIERVIAMYAK